MNNVEEEHEERLDNKFKENYRKTIFLYAESKISKIKKRNEYVGYLSYECGITNPDIYHKQLINDGYFERATTEQVLSKLKVSELKEILEKNNLTAKGKKIV